MATALEINAQQYITNGQGLAVSANLLAEISAFQNHQPIQFIANVFSNAMGANATVGSNLLPALSSLGTGAGLNAWMIDFWSSNIAPAYSGGNVSTYGTYVTPIYDPNPAHWSSDGEGGYTQPIIGYDYNPIISTTSFSNAVKQQAQLPFTSGIQEFANVYSKAAGFSSGNFDLTSSTHLLQNKTYGDMGIGFKGPVDLVTGGLNTNNGLLANVVANWGTMYDIRNMDSIADVYIFGQHLLDQGFGSYGNLSVDMTAAGLNVHDIRAVPQPTTTISVNPATVSYSSTIGTIDLPTVDATVTTSSVASGSSSDVLLNVYSEITDSNLAAIVSATGLTNRPGSTITSLVDYLDLRKVTTTDEYEQLNRLGIATLDQFGQYLHGKIGQGYFASWADVATFLRKINVPSLPHLSAGATASTRLLSDTTVSNIFNKTGQGSGPFTDTVLTDYLGAVAGIPYTSVFGLLNSYYDSVVPRSLLSAVQQLDSAVNTYLNSTSYDPETGWGMPDINPVNTAVDNINSIVAGALSSQKLSICQQEYYTAISKLPQEVAALHKAGVVFNAGYPQTLESFGKNIGSIASDSTRQFTYQFFANLITNDIAGDTIRAVIAETINTELMSGVGMKVKNDPQPMMAIYNAEQQNIPITTYISQNQ